LAFAQPRDQASPAGRCGRTSRCPLATGAAAGTIACDDVGSRTAVKQQCVENEHTRNLGVPGEQAGPARRHKDIHFGIRERAAQLAGHAERQKRITQVADVRDQDATGMSGQWPGFPSKNTADGAVERASRCV
jgi:hypothetical protein